MEGVGSEGVMIKVDLQLTAAPRKQSAKPSPKTGVAD